MIFLDSKNPKSKDQNSNKAQNPKNKTLSEDLGGFNSVNKQASVQDILLYIAQTSQVSQNAKCRPSVGHARNFASAHRTN